MEGAGPELCRCHWFPGAMRGVGGEWGGDDDMETTHFLFIQKGLGIMPLLLSSKMPGRK